MTQTAEVTAEKAVSKEKFVLPKVAKVVLGIIGAVTLGVIITSYIDSYGMFLSSNGSELPAYFEKYYMYIFPYVGAIACFVINYKNFHPAEIKNFSYKKLAMSRKVLFVLSLIWALPTIWLLKPLLFAIPVGLDNATDYMSKMWIYGVVIEPTNTLFDWANYFIECFTSYFTLNNLDNYLIQAPAIVAGYALCKTFFVKK
ncbi:MAG: hypothetical protein RR540_05635 [Oscillospiraceae bacterium]